MKRSKKRHESSQEKFLKLKTKKYQLYALARSLAARLSGDEEGVAGGQGGRYEAQATWKMR